MPARLIRESIRSSETLASLTAEQERHFYRLLTTSDDTGRFDARNHVIRASCYQAMLDKVSITEVEEWTCALDLAGLVHLYEVDGKRYGHFTTFEKYNRLRGTSKYPPPALQQADTTLPQPAASAADVGPQVAASAAYSESESESETESPPPTPSPNGTGKKKTWAGEPWWEPLTELSGYERGNHSAAQSSVAKAAADAGVEPADVVKELVQVWPVGVLSKKAGGFGWKRPHLVIVTTLNVQIAKVKRHGTATRHPQQIRAGTDGWRKLPFADR